MIKLAIIEDGPVIRRNIMTFIGFQDDMELVSECESVEMFLKQAGNFSSVPDILILDIGLPGVSGIEGITPIKEKLPDLDIIMLTTYEEEDKIVAALRAGACSYLSKRTPLNQIMDSIRIVSQGGSYMSPSIARRLSQFMIAGAKKPNFSLSKKQEEVMLGLIDGYSYKEIASRMEVSIETIRTHVKRIYLELHVNNKASAITKYLNK